MTKATEKQVSFALYLLGKAGYSTRYMDSSFKRLGAKNEREERLCPRLARRHDGI